MLDFYFRFVSHQLEIPVIIKWGFGEGGTNTEYYGFLRKVIYHYVSGKTQLKFHTRTQVNTKLGLGWKLR